jgi:prevent-host-death family protein
MSIGILVRMTRIRRRRAQAARNGHWALQDAKARFSELVRKAKTEGPQRITIHGREEVVVVSVEEYRRVKGQATGQALVDVLQDAPLDDVKLDRKPLRGKVRGVEL